MSVRLINNSTSKLPFSLIECKIWHFFLRFGFADFPIHILLCLLGEKLKNNYVGEPTAVLENGLRLISTIHEPADYLPCIIAWNPFITSHSSVRLCDSDLFVGITIGNLRQYLECPNYEASKLFAIAAQNWKRPQIPRGVAPYDPETASAALGYTLGLDCCSHAIRVRAVSFAKELWCCAFGEGDESFLFFPRYPGWIHCWKMWSLMWAHAIKKPSTPRCRISSCRSSTTRPTSILCSPWWVRPAWMSLHASYWIFTQFSTDLFVEFGRIGSCLCWTFWTATTWKRKRPDGYWKWSAKIRGTAALPIRSPSIRWYSSPRFCSNTRPSNDTVCSIGPIPD